MAETIQGGAYLAVDGKTFIDSEGRPLSKEAQAQAEERAAEKEANVVQLIEAEQAQAAMQQTALARALMGTAAAQPAPAPKTAGKTAKSKE